MRARVIPVLSVIDQGLVKTINFAKPRYLGDPLNAVKMFNNKYVDELCIIDIRCSVDKSEIDYDFLYDIASQAFMPLSYGGGLKNLTQVKKILGLGYEKIIVNSALVENPSFIKEVSHYVGSQSIVVSIDYKVDKRGNKFCFINSGKTKTKFSPVELAKRAEEFGAGELILNSINEDGIMNGYDIDTIKEVVNSVSIPVVALGGAGKLEDLRDAIIKGKAHAVAAGSLFVYIGKKKSILINYPTESDLDRILVINENKIER